MKNNMMISLDGGVTFVQCTHEPIVAISINGENEPSQTLELVIDQQEISSIVKNIDGEVVGELVMPLSAIAFKAGLPKHIGYQKADENPQVIQAIQDCQSFTQTSIKLSVPEIFACKEFQNYINSTNVMTWHLKDGPIQEVDYADVAVFFDASLNGEGTDSDMPYWDAIFEKVKSIIGNRTRYDEVHIPVILTNC